MSIQCKWAKNGGDISIVLEALRVEDLDSSVQTPFALLPHMKYASTLKNPVDRYRQTMMEDFEFTDGDCSFSQGKHKLDFEWRCAVIANLMGKPNSTNTFDFMLRENGDLTFWVRIFGLPVKYFKEFTVAKIGKILGDVVRVGKLTIGQSRGKFARVCVEVDLSKPLRPYVEVESTAYNVVYEGISLICFECGCFGHSKDKCPTLKFPANDSIIQHDPSSDTALAHTNDSTRVVPSDVNMTSVQNGQVSPPPCDVIKEDMGPWMLMIYRNKKKSNDSGAAKKHGNSSSRFSILQEESGMESVLPEKTIKDNHVDIVAPIVKLWKNFQDKKKVASVSTKANSASDTDAILKSPDLAGKLSPAKVTSVFADKSNMKSKGESQ
ncbi:uncharacterized protein LOC121050689 [Rosa chinensis]|uniref:uncharacterized protein LOC121050689 n=1 Tax=Rosa chinensis TaxID=74649 RepID=UPI001AD8FF6A|nr:uncharacterized protein LOC121050689 [Rosa chinensis]